MPKGICEKYLSMQIRRQNEEISRMIGDLALDNVDVDIRKGKKEDVSGLSARSRLHR